MSNPTPDLSEENLARIAAITDFGQKAAALKALQDAVDQEYNALKASKPAQLTATEFLSELASLNTKSPAAIRDFKDRTKFSPFGDLPTAPVPLGSHARMSYFLVPNSDGVPMGLDPGATELDNALPVAEGVVSYQRIPIDGAKMPGAPAIKFGFGLGRLMYADPTTLTSQTVSFADMMDAGFFVICNAVDKSIWIAVDWYPNSAEGVWVGYDQDDTSWGRLPNDKSLQIGVMRISSPGWEKMQTPSLANGDPFKRMSPALGSRLEGSTAIRKHFDEAMAGAS